MAQQFSRNDNGRLEIRGKVWFGGSKQKWKRPRVTVMSPHWTALSRSNGHHCWWDPEMSLHLSIRTRKLLHVEIKILRRGSSPLLSSAFECLLRNVIPPGPDRPWYACMRAEWPDSWFPRVLVYNVLSKSCKIYSPSSDENFQGTKFFSQRETIWRAAGKFVPKFIASEFTLPTDPSFFLVGLPM